MNNTNEYSNFKEVIGESKADLLEYINKQIQLFKLNAYEKIAKSASYLFYILMAVVIGLIFFIMLLIGIGLTLGEALNNYALGFGILILFILLILVGIFVFGKKVRKAFVNMTLSTIKKIESDEV